MNASDFVKQAWALKDEAQRKDFVRAHVHSLPQGDVEAALLAELERAGWNIGLLMVALRVLQVVASEVLLHALMAMVSEGATFVPGGDRLRPWLDGHLKGLLAKQPALAEAATRYRRPDWAKRPSERAGARPRKPAAASRTRTARAPAPSTRKRTPSSRATPKKPPRR
jgi:hypothetical protein